MFNIKKSLLCIIAISCMSLYASFITVNIPITIGSTPSVPTKTDYNYWSTEAEEDNTYVFNRDKGKNDKHWIPKNTVTVDNDYTLKLTTNYTDRYYCVLDCYNIFTNNGNVIIDKYGILAIKYNKPIGNSNNNGAIDIINGGLAVYDKAKLNNTGTITLTGSSFIYIYCSCSTLTNTGTIDISDITNLSGWYNDNIFTLEGGSTFILPKSITNKIKTNKWKKPITLNGTDNKPVNIVIPKGCEYITDIDNNKKEELFNAIEDATGFTFGENKDNVKFSWQTDDVKQTTETSADNECEYMDEC